MGENALVIGLADNLLRPILVGRGTRMPDYLILFATLGGLALFGITGFVLGPVLAALFLVVWEMFSEHRAPDAAAQTETAAPAPNRASAGGADPSDESSP